MFLVLPIYLVCIVYWGVGYLEYRKTCGPVDWNGIDKYTPGAVLPLVSKDVIVRSVYFDDRSRSGHRNASVFMVEARRHLVDEGKIVGCQIGEYFGEHIQIRRLALMDAYIHVKHAYVNHDLLMVDCFDLPVKNGSRAFILFRKKSLKGEENVFSVESERPLFFPAPRISRGNDPRLLVCVATARFTVYDRRLTVYGLLYQWLKYQRVIGVDHVHFIAHPSFLKVGSLQNDVFLKAILDQFVSIEFWEPWLNETDNYHGHSQMLAYQDCAYKFRGTYDYMVMCDTDDFFIPRVPNEIKFHYYIQRWCHYGACRFHWIERYPDCGLDEGHVIKDGNFTRLLKSNAAQRLTDNKSLYKSSIVLDVGIHMPMEIMSGYSVIHVPSNVAYFAHVRHAHSPQGRNTC